MMYGNAQTIDVGDVFQWKSNSVDLLGSSWIFWKWHVSVCGIQFWHSIQWHFLRNFVKNNSTYGYSTIAIPFLVHRTDPAL